MKTLDEIIRGPIHLAPNRVWRMYAGGAILGHLQGDPDAIDTEFPEEWVGSTVQASNPGPHYREGEGLALIAEGLPDPVRLKTLLERYPEPLLGPDHVRAFGSNAALLAKLLDAAVRLVIHAHPTKAFALEHLGSCFGKTEAWFVIGTRPTVDEPYVLLAFKEEVSRQRYRVMLDRQDLPSMISVMHRVPVRTGDVVYVRAGLPHAIGEGVLLVELQEPTDYSILLERVCATYTFREDESFLGLDPALALSALNHRVFTADEVRRELVIRPRIVRREGESTETELLGYDTTECFAGRRLDILGEYSDTTGGRYALLIVLRGTGVLAHAGGEISLRPGMELFVPASMGSHAYRSAGGMAVFKCLPARIP